MANTATVAERMHHEIEVMTRRLELEKRRLQRLEKELEAARRTEHAKRPTTARPSTPRIPPYRPNSGSGAAAARCLSARGPRPPVAASTEEEEGETEVEMLPMKHLVIRLENELKKLDISKNENTDLKKQIHGIRMHKKQLTMIFERLKLHIKHRTEQLQDFVEDTAQSKGVSGDALNRVEVMKRQRESERSQFKSEVMRIRKDLQSYEVEKREIEVQLKRAEEGVQKKKELIVPEEEKDFSESSMMRRIMKTAFLNCIQRRHIKQHQKSIEVFEQAFATIKQSTGISNIEEIVKIFVSLESRNYSLLTYVNHMNRDIEALEGLRRNRREMEMQHKHEEEQDTQDRNEALGDMKKKLEATQLAMEDDREGCFQHREILRMILPQIAQVAKRLEQEGNRLRNAAKELDGSEFPPRPNDELRDDTVLAWLNWVKEALSRFRDLPFLGDGSREHFFASTAGPVVKSIPPKRSLQSQPPPLVKYQELPSAPKPDDELGGTQKRSALAKGDFDDESEEEDFGDRPLMLKDIRSRAEQASARKKKREHPIRRSVAYDGEGSEQRVTLGMQDRTPAATLDPRGNDSIRRSVAFNVSGGDPVVEAGPPRSGSEKENVDGSNKEGTANDEEEAQTIKHKLNQRVVQMMELASATYREEQVDKDELDLVFLRRYKMSRQELEIMSSRMGLQLAHLCFLKKQFDKYDQDQSGYISAQELYNLFVSLGEEHVSEEECASAVKELDGDGSGEIEFFEFAEWFTGPQS
mmetsp:Transcript_16277/g.28419  ORF Transcript_16277/g.28419 Transcript_16277/m.28419 type:complete len:754 (+) Transcript_16277:78-2339(+)